MKNSNQSSVSLLKESGSFKFEIKAKHKPDGKVWGINVRDWAEIRGDLIKTYT